MKNALYIRDKDGNFVGIPAISGANGKSAYEQAVEGGYVGTEEVFIRALASLGGEYAIQLAENNAEYDEHIANKNNPHGVTVEQIGAAISDLKITPLPTPDEPTDIRTFIWQYPTGHYTANAEISTKLMLPIQGVDVNIDWFRCEDARYNGRYGTLIVRQMVVNSKTFMCSIYNTSSYTEWEEFYTKTNKPTASDVGALPIEGGVITGSVLGLGNGLAQIVGGPTYSSISAVSQNDYNNHRILRAINPDLTSYPLEKAAQMIDSRNGVPYEYNLFGEHNASYFGLSRLYVGSYVGTGVYGSSGETTIPQILPFKPKFMYVVSAANIKANLFFDLGVGFAITSPGSTTTHQLSCRLDGTKPYWYSNSDALNQLNATANTYYFVALG